MARASNGNSSIDAIEQAVRGCDPAAVFAPVWLLRRIIAADRGLTGRAAWSSHAQLHALSRRRLLELIDRENLPFSAEEMLQPTVILLARPETQWLENTPAPQALLHYWRLLFHARIHAQLDEKLETSEAAIEERIERIGRSDFNDARFVLLKERYIAASADERQVYIEFAAAFLENYCFARPLLRHLFPAIERPERVLTILGEDVDAEELLRRTRPEGAAEIASTDDRSRRSEEVSEEPPPTRRGLAYRKAILKKAERAEGVGNVVRGAILRMTAARLVRNEAGLIHAHAIRDLDELVRRLQAALGFDDGRAAQWRTALAPLLGHAARGWWNPEGRLLYDLQKVCIDHEREIFHVGVIEWIASLGRHPLRRPLPAQQVVLICKHLRSAARRLHRVRLSDQERGQLEHLMRVGVHDAEHRLREELRPRIEIALRDGGLRTTIAAERIAYRKLVEELLDGIVRRGYSSMGDLRDSISRNQMKLDDLASLGELFAGDQLLRIDRRLAGQLDGVYRRGEFYLRFFQRLSSVMFGTPVGRFLTRCAILPFGGSYLTLAFLMHTLGALLHKLAGVTLELEPSAHNLGHSLPPFLLLSLFLFCIINWRAFRLAVGRYGKAIGRGIRWVFVELPRWVSSRPLLRAILDSKALRLFMRYVVKPSIIAGIAWLLLPRHWSHDTRLTIAVSIFFAANLLNSKFGRFIEHATIHSLTVIWTRLTADILAGAFRWVVHLFQVVLESIDRTLYAVDEWLRFRGGQPRLSLIGKAVLGTAWFFVMYLTRFVINLLIEPQINPIKHFPVVTVSHKIILPTQRLWAAALEGMRMGSIAANTTATLIVTGIPGIFGFFAWELNENWKLYKANRATTLRPVRMGSHGESVARLVRPGIHSGTVPKIFARLRKAERRAGSRRAGAAARKQVEALEHVEESVRHFLQRELIELINQHPLLMLTPLSLGEIHLATTRISVELCCPQLGSESAILCFENRWGWVLAGIERAGWIDNLGEEQAKLIGVGLIGLYKMSGVDIVREQIESMFAPFPVRCEVMRDQLVVWPAGRFDMQVLYELLDESPSPRLAMGDAQIELPTLQRQRIMLRYIPVRWEDWVSVWESADGAAARERILGNVCVLPADVARRMLAMSEESWATE